MRQNLSTIFDTPSKTNTNGTSVPEPKHFSQIHFIVEQDGDAAGIRCIVSLGGSRNSPVIKFVMGGGGNVPDEGDDVKL